jgi:hypothetical protein
MLNRIKKGGESFLNSLKPTVTRVIIRNKVSNVDSFLKLAHLPHRRSQQVALESLSWCNSMGVFNGVGRKRLGNFLIMNSI